jgi:hypothetical protein
MVARRFVPLLLALLLPACGLTWHDAAKISGEIVTHLPDAGTPAEPPAAAAYVVARDQREERTLSVGGSLEFWFEPARDGSAQNEDVAAWICSGGDCSGWNGGNPEGQFGVRVNSYDANTWKMKVIGPAGACGEPKLSTPWRAGSRYKVKLESLVGKVRLTVDGRPIEQACDVPQRVTFGRGWPPSKRQGALGAKETDATWTDGAGFPKD